MNTPAHKIKLPQWMTSFCFFSTLCFLKFLAVIKPDKTSKIGKNIRKPDKVTYNSSKTHQCVTKPGIYHLPADGVGPIGYKTNCHRLEELGK